MYVVVVVELPPKSVVVKAPVEVFSETPAPLNTLVVSENTIALSPEAAIVAIVPENPPSKVPNEPAAVENVGLSDTVNIEPDKTASPSPFSILILYEPSTGKVAVTVIVVELLNATESAK